MNFHSIYSHGFARVAACTIVSSVANPTANATAIIDAASACHEKSVAVAVFPELCLSGYAIEDLLLQDALLDATERALATVVEASTRFMSVLVVGAPLRQGGRIYNCAVVVHRGRVLGVVPKTYLPTYREFYEARHFGSGKDVVGLEICDRHDTCALRNVFDNVGSSSIERMIPPDPRRRDCGPIISSAWPTITGGS